ncbi:hypothetical protein BKY29_07460 [Weissella confusa]|uniref:hypothetical protein n=1 Tax=Weissella confusa TaxID=1583 RepID=UPI0008FDB2E3|nr:hypothetical protein [Weissella confusa]OJF03248.1 hypothetical protein BKY29_07460 [Weissella confusa]
MAGVNRNFDDFLEQKDISISAYIRDSDNDGSVFGKLSNITVRISDFQNLYEEYQKNVSKWSFIVDEENQNEYYAMISNTSDEVVYVLNTISNRVRRRRDFEAKVLEGNGFRYSLNEISKENILLMMALIEKFNHSRDHFRHFERSLDLEPDENIVDAIIRQALNFMIRSGNYIFRIHSNEPIDAKQFNQAYINYRFNHAYFTGETLVRKKYELHSRSPRRGGVKSEEKPPLKDYNPTLVEYYTHALSTTEEMSQLALMSRLWTVFFGT